MNAKPEYCDNDPYPVWHCQCGKMYGTKQLAERCCAPKVTQSAQDAMNRQQEEIKELLISAKKKVYMAIYAYDLNDACDAIDRIVEVLAKMNGVEDVLK